MAGGGFRTMATVLAHRPYQGDTAQKYLYNLGLGIDGIAQKVDEGIHARMVLDAPETALPLIGSDRGVLRGLTESADNYRVRLQRALDDYQYAGNARAVLRQVLGYLLEDTPEAMTVSSTYDATGTMLTTQWNVYAAGADTEAEPTHTYEDPGNWDWDSASPTNGSWGWWRWYLAIKSIAPNDWATPAPTWGNAGALVGEYTGSCGFEQPTSTFATINIITGQWKSSVSHWIIVSFDAAFVDPSGTPGVENPDGEYGRWSKVVSGVHRRARSENGRYWHGPR